MNAAARKIRNAKVRELTFLVLNTEGTWVSVDHIVSLCDNAFRFRMSYQRLAQIMKKDLRAGNILTQWREETTSWRIPFEPESETL